MINKKILVILMLSSLLMGTVPVSAVTQQDNGLINVYENNVINTPSNVGYVPGEIIVKFKPGVKGREIANINSKHKTEVLSTSQHGDFKLLKIAKGKSVPEMVEIYNRNPNVEYAEPNMIAYAHSTPNDPYYGYQWHFDQINMESAWDISTGSGVIVAVLDTGVAQDLEDSPVYFVQGKDFINIYGDADDDNGHGSHVAGTIAQNTNNGLGVAGVAYDAYIMPVKVLDSGGSGTYFNIADGIVWAADNGADVISMSLGGPCDFSSGLLEDALSYAYYEGVVIVASSGNFGREKYSCPAAYDDYVIAVGATRFDEAVPRYSSYYSYTDHPIIKQYVDMTAPGGDTRVDQNSDGYPDGVLQNTFGSSGEAYYFYQGTSMAAPHVAGVAALVIAYGNADANGDGTTSPDEVRNVLESSAKDKDVPGWDPKYGYGIVDAYAALTYTTAPNIPPVADTEDPMISGATGNTYGYTGEPVTISATITDNVDVVSAAVHYTPIGAQEITSAMTEIGLDVWSVYVPVASDQVGTIVYYITAQDAAANSAVDPDLGSYDITVTDNDDPIAEAGPSQSVLVSEEVSFDGSVSSDNVGIASYSWDFDANNGISEDATGSTVIHTYTGAGTYNVTLTIIDDASLSASDTLTVIVNEPSAEIVVFQDNFEGGFGNWMQDRQNDWFVSTQRATDGTNSAEVDGRASNAKLTSITIDLQGKTDATITFSWYIESGLDSGEYLAFNVSTDGGTTWVEEARLEGNVDTENVWHAESIDLTGIDDLRIQFRGKMSSSSEAANVDMVMVTAS
ncbi:MAG: PKD domain-containing protein [ANME-2 cluster archaeon]|nr:MAG: PKD domain-containing protein [ANME-2 cluster archaeon]